MRAAAAGLLLLVACGDEAGDPSAGPASATARNALLITLDTTRSDALSLYGFMSPSTPNIDALAAEGVTYDVCRTVAPSTLPSGAAIQDPPSANTSPSSPAIAARCRRRHAASP